MCKIKYFLLLKNKSTFLFDDKQSPVCCLFKIDFKFMNTNKITKYTTTEIKEKLKKSKFDLLTNENDFLVKSLKKPGQSLGFQNYFFKNILNLKFVLLNTTINRF